MRTNLQRRFLVLALVAVAPLAARAQTIDLETLAPLRLVEELRIGHRDDPDLGFTRIGPMALDRDGNVYVWDIQSYHLRVYGPDGRRLRTIGRRGEGPGEFRNIGSVGVKGDTVWTVTDGGGSCRVMISLFKRDGTFLTSAQSAGSRVLLSGGTTTVSRPMTMRADGSFIGGEPTCFTGSANAPPGGPGPRDTVRVPRVLFDMKGNVTDTLGWHLRPPPAERARRDTAIIEGRRHPLPPPPTDERIELALTDGRLTVDRATPRSAAPATIRVVRTGFRGDTIFDRQLRYTPLRYTSSALDSIAAGSARIPGGSYRLVNNVPEITPFANPDAARATIRARLSFPPFQVPISSSSLGQDGSLWLRREDNGGPAFRWVVLNPDGRPRGRVEIPRNVRLAWTSGSTVWATWSDEDDVQWLVRYRLESGGR
jgi:hypothetical protein